MGDDRGLWGGVEKVSSGDVRVTERVWGGVGWVVNKIHQTLRIALQASSRQFDSKIKTKKKDKSYWKVS